MSEYLSTMQAKAFPKMSALELQDRQIQGTCPLGIGCFPEGILKLTLSGRELYSGHDYMDGVEEFGHLGGFYYSRYVLLFFEFSVTHLERQRYLHFTPGYCREPNLAERPHYSF
jgi:hypothetical protein